MKVEKWEWNILVGFYNWIKWNEYRGRWQKWIGHKLVTPLSSRAGERIARVHCIIEHAKSIEHARSDAEVKAYPYPQQFTTGRSINKRSPCLYIQVLRAQDIRAYLRATLSLSNHPIKFDSTSVTSLVANQKLANSKTIYTSTHLFSLLFANLMTSFIRKSKLQNSGKNLNKQYSRSCGHFQRYRHFLYRQKNCILIPAITQSSFFFVSHLSVLIYVIAI